MSDSTSIYKSLFKKQKANQFAIANTSAKVRIGKLNALKKAIEVTYKDKIREALAKDLGKPTIESDLTEIYQVIGEIKHAKANLRLWMKRQKVETPLAMLGASSWVHHEPKGVCLIISPWNFPFNLTFGPLVSAIAAGNTVIIKPSEMTPNCSALMAKMVGELFMEEEVALVEGAIKESQELLKLPFNHIFFTGSPTVGKIIMKAAAEHLTSVTLELGGKSPTVIDSNVNIKQAAKRIMWGKFMNAGQICVAPDYVLIHESLKERFIEACKLQLKEFFSLEMSDSKSFGRIVNKKHFERLLALLNDAKDNNAKIEIGGEHNTNDKYIDPTILSDVAEESSILKEEIFGPLLPIISFKNLDEAITYINKGEKPLALYIYSRSKSTVKKVIQNTRAGSTCINQNLIQYSNHYLPFGGSNNSGIGKSHGYYGFKAFSNERAVMKQHVKGINEWLFPPYNNLKQKLTDFTLKWF